MKGSGVSVIRRSASRNRKDGTGGVMQPTRRTTDYAETLAFQIHAMHLPAPVREFRPFADRKFRIDVSWPDRLIAVEVDGGEWTVGRHSRGVGMQTDNEKCNRLTAEGWSVFRFTGTQVTNGSAIGFLEQVLVICRTPPQDQLLRRDSSGQSSESDALTTDLAQRKTIGRDSGADVDNSQVGQGRAVLPAPTSGGVTPRVLEQLIAVWRRRIAGVREEQCEATNKGHELEARILGHRIEVWDRCANELESAVRSSLPSVPAAETPIKSVEARASAWLRASILAKGTDGREDQARSEVERCIIRINGSCSGRDLIRQLTEFVISVAA